MNTVQEPPLLEVDFTSQAFKQDPFATLARLRAGGPVIRVRLPFFGKVWLATHYDAVNDLLRDHPRFVQDPARGGNRWMGTIVRWLPGNLRPLATNMLLRDPPDHRRLRGLVEQAFQRNSIESLRPRLEVLVGEALDALADRAARSPGGVDLVAHFARPFPLAVICEMLGLPPEDRPRFSRWAMQFSSADSVPGALWGLFTGVSRLMHYIRQEFRRRRRRPGEGLMGALIEVEEAGERLSEDELVAMVFLLLAAGHETTLYQIAGGLLTLLDHPGQFEELRADPRLDETAVQELLRHLSLAQLSKPRYAAQDTEFHGQPIRRGQVLLGCLAAANTDPAAFEGPEALDLRRHPNRHLAFGAGIHFCLGAKLARVETALALRGLISRFPRLRLAVPRSQIRFTSRLGMRAVAALPIQLE